MARHDIYHRPPERFMTDADLVSETYRGIQNQPGDRKFETPRATYMSFKIDYKEKTVLDIGCNTGFFLYHALDLGAASCVGYEGSQAANDFIKSNHINNNKVQIYNSYFDFSKPTSQSYDIIHLLNVVHHFGYDYGERLTDSSSGKEQLLNDIDRLADSGQWLVFQMGFNWHGDINKPIFQNGSKQEVISFLDVGLRRWKISDIGIPIVTDKNTVTYDALNDKNIERTDSIGEFLNRPLFIMESQ